MKIEMEKKDRELSSYRKTIEALTEELDGLGTRVKELEQALLLGSKESQGKVKGDMSLEQVMRDLQNVKEEKAKYQELLQEQTENVIIMCVYN